MLLIGFAGCGVWLGVMDVAIARPVVGTAPHRRCRHRLLLYAGVRLQRCCCHVVFNHHCWLLICYTQFDKLTNEDYLHQTKQIPISQKEIKKWIKRGWKTIKNNKLKINESVNQAISQYLFINNKHWTHGTQ